MKPNFYIVLLILMIASTKLKSQDFKGSFLQDLKTEIALPSEAGKNVIKLFSANQSVVVVTKNGVFRFGKGNWSGQS